MDYVLVEETDVETVSAAIRQGIRGADPPDVGRRDWLPLVLSLRDRDGALLGGLYGATMWEWLMIDGLWVADALRGQGHGRDLLQAAEAAASARGCRGAWLGTFDFQAKDFYERLGYTVFARMPDFPPGHTHYHLRKVFGSPATA